RSASYRRRRSSLEHRRGGRWIGGRLGIGTNSLYLKKRKVPPSIRNQKLAIVLASGRIADPIAHKHGIERERRKDAAQLWLVIERHDEAAFERREYLGEPVEVVAREQPCAVLFLDAVVGRVEIEEHTGPVVVLNERREWKALDHD